METPSAETPVYEPPELICLGSLEELTAASQIGQNPDQAFNS